ncbi:MAG TPA: 5-oxoprolinase subunit PxpA [Syntrophorhabdaceae bacterium]|nr:5-oxoprolinase subunit PxpA [Syntrophorhabdaceae bacterium]
MAVTVDLNCDMGESFGEYTAGNDAEAAAYVTSSNIACGAHASDPTVMRRTIRLCGDHNVMVGAHPGYPDLQGFGRRRIEMDHEEIIDSVIYQVGALKGFADHAGVPLQHVKLHGALYHYALGQEKLFVDIAENLRKAFGDIILLTMGTAASIELRSICRKSGARIALEAFPDRVYDDDGALLSRSRPGAVIKDAGVIAQRAISMVKRKGTESLNGRWIDLAIDTICIHGDNRESILAAPMIRRRAEREGIEVRPLGSFV